MALSCLSVMGNNITRSIPSAKPINVDFLASIGPFTTTFSGSAGSYTSSTTKTITGTSFLNGTYTIRCNYWIMEGTTTTPSSALGMMFDNNTSSYCSSVFSGSDPKFGYNGNQRGDIGAPYNSSTGAYLLGATFKTTYITDYVGDYIDVYYPMAVIMKKYRIMTRINATARYPRQLYFFGSNDNGTNWGLLHSYLVPSTTSGTYAETTFPVTTNSYTVYRMVINSVNSGGGGFWNIAQLNMIFDVA